MAIACRVQTCSKQKFTETLFTFLHCTSRFIAAVLAFGQAIGDVTFAFYLSTFLWKPTNSRRRPVKLSSLHSYFVQVADELYMIPNPASSHVVDTVQKQTGLSRVELLRRISTTADRKVRLWNACTSMQAEQFFVKRLLQTLGLLRCKCFGKIPNLKAGAYLRTVRVHCLWR